MYTGSAMSETAHILRNTALQIGGKVLGTFLGLGTFFLLVRTYGDVGFGLLTTALTYVSLFAIVVDFGLTLTVAQMISEDGADEEDILSSLFSLRVVTALVFLALPILFLPLVPRGGQLLPLVLLSVASSFFGSIAQVFVGVFQKRLQIAAAVWAETANRCVAALFAVVAWWMALPLWVAAAGFAFGAFTQLFFMLTSVRQRVHLHMAWNVGMWWKIVARSWPIGVSIIFNLLYLKGDVLFLWYFGRGAAEIGQYGSAYKVVDVMTMVPVTFMGMMLPQLRAAWTKQHHEGFRQLLQRGWDVMIALALPGAAITVLLGPQLMTFVSPDLLLAGQLLTVLGPAAAVVFLGSFFGHLIVALDQQRVMTWGYVFVAIVAIALYVGTIPVYGAWGAAWTTLIAETLITLATAAVCLWTIPFRWRWRTTVAAVLATAAMSTLFLLFPAWPLLVLLPAGAAVFAGGMFAFGPLAAKDLLLLLRADRNPT